MYDTGQHRPTRTHNSQQRPTKANKGPQQAAMAIEDQRRPTTANEGQRRPTTANEGQRQPMQANDGQHRPATANAGQCRGLPPALCPYQHPTSRFDLLVCFWLPTPPSFAYTNTQQVILTCWCIFILELTIFIKIRYDIF